MNIGEKTRYRKFSVSRAGIFGIVFAAAAGAAALPQAAQAQADWVSDESIGCWVWRPYPEKADGMRWVGACADGKVTGLGIVQWLRGSQAIGYEVGEFKDGLADGVLMSFALDKTRSTASYKGWIGQGLVTHDWQNGDAYAGEWSDGQINGVGVLKWKSGDRYAGEWREGEREGEGVHQFKGGGTYRGALFRGSPHGVGVIDSGEGTYSGAWHSGRYHGLGQSTDGKTSEYLGQHEAGLRQGAGIIEWKGGERYAGSWIRASAPALGCTTSRKPANSLVNSRAARSSAKAPVVGAQVALTLASGRTHECTVSASLCGRTVVAMRAK